MSTPRPRLRLVGDTPAQDPVNDPAAPPPAPDELSPVLEDVVQRFGDFVRRTAHRHGMVGSEVEDVIQELRIRLWRSLGSAERIRQVPASYVYRTAVTSALDFLRRRRSRRVDYVETLPDEGAAAAVAPAEADDLVRTDDVARVVARAIDLMVESRRGVVRMYLAGYGREEIASLLGWTEARTRNLLYRGLADLRRTLASWGYGPGGEA